jgi:hypothetical protein
MIGAIREVKTQIAGLSGDISNLVSLSEEARGANGERYFVEPNYGVDSQGYGKSWDKPFGTVAHALAVSHANIGLKSSTWAKRNSIYYGGYDVPESLTKLAQKTDLVGMGTYDHHHMPGIIGTHVIDSVASYMGFRFFNICLKKVAGGAAAIITLSTAQSGIGFIGCEIDGSDPTVSTIGILATAVEKLRILGCQFIGKFSAEAIALGAGEANDLLIRGNDIMGAVVGILVDTGLTTSVRHGRIVDNNIYTSGCTVNDVSQKLICTGNRFVSAAATGTASLNINPRLAAGNWYTDGSKAGNYPVTA